ncbi:hypothetical protein [Spiroplasma endosymbiont of Aspidapion aeneum]|uniref:hypothetical protein n=1 Tax=Spiroplasma endosymbiont of Aspidapion aeneum TaxID=3066276 RepID=UPI00313D1CB4
MKSMLLFQQVIDIGGYDKSDYYPYIESIINLGFDYAREDYSRFQSRELAYYDINDEYDELIHKWNDEYDMRKFRFIDFQKILKNLPTATKLFIQYRDKENNEIEKELVDIITVSYHVWVDEKIGQLLE